jgi:hypothetical protein
MRSLRRPPPQLRPFRVTDGCHSLYGGSRMKAIVRCYEIVRVLRMPHLWGNLHDSVTHIDARMHRLLGRRENVRVPRFVRVRAPAAESSLKHPRDSAAPTKHKSGAF